MALMSVKTGYMQPFTPGVLFDAFPGVHPFTEGLNGVIAYSTLQILLERYAYSEIVGTFILI